MYTSVVTAAGSTKNAYWEPPLARNDIVPLPALMSVGSSTTPQMVYVWREKTSVEEASAPASAPSAPAPFSPSEAPRKVTSSPRARPLSSRKRLVTATWSDVTGRWPSSTWGWFMPEGLRALTSTFSDEEPTVV